jgi:hypothetical protein
VTYSAGLHVTGIKVFSMLIDWVPAESPIEKEAGKIWQLPPAVEVSYWWVQARVTSKFP